MRNIAYIEENKANRELAGELIETKLPGVRVITHNFESAKWPCAKKHDLIIANLSKGYEKRHIEEMEKILKKNETAPLIITIENREYLKKSGKALKQKFGAAAIIEKNPLNFNEKLLEIVSRKLQHPAEK